MVTRALQRRSWNVLGLASLPELTAKTELAEYDVLVVDVAAQNDLRALRAIRAALPDLPLLLMVGGPLEITGSEIPAGSVELVTKPFSLSEIYRALDNLIARTV
ncbi:MAG: hypothetical protein ACT443_02000 [Gemmatimonadota bacterium]